MMCVSRTAGIIRYESDPTPKLQHRRWAATDAPKASKAGSVGESVAESVGKSVGESVEDLSTELPAPVPKVLPVPVPSVPVSIVVALILVAVPPVLAAKQRRRWTVLLFARMLRPARVQHFGQDGSCPSSDHGLIDDALFQHWVIRVSRFMPRSTPRPRSLSS